MKKNLALMVFLFAALIALIFFLSNKTTPKELTDLMLSGADPANTTYLVDGAQVTLVGGVAETAIADSSSTTRTAIFDQPVIGDLDADGDKDMALLLQRETGGSGMFYYLAVALQNTDTTAQGLNTILVGDRIAPQSIQIKDGIIIFNYVTRKPDEPMTATPSVGVSLYAAVEDGVLVQREPLKPGVAF